MLVLYLMLVVVVWHQDSLQKGKKIDSKIDVPMLDDKEGDNDEDDDDNDEDDDKNNDNHDLSEEDDPNSDTQKL